MREKGYPLEGFLRQIIFREEDRCRYCYRLRLVKTALIAKKGRFDAFTTTLLYSRFQKHDLIRSIGEEVAGEYDIPFFYRDFREGWLEGIQISKALGLYRQPYCGCIYSEKERYCPTAEV
jgi:predicted adenine nucleotide alpha hydrolase (AANH) superfamily ATPase